MRVTVHVVSAARQCEPYVQKANEMINEELTVEAEKDVQIVATLTESSLKV